MKNVKFGDILTAEKGFIVHGCNAQGVMGSGIAKSIRDKWPSVYTEYRDAYERGQAHLGKVILAEVGPDLWVANAITQQNFGRDKSVRYVSYRAIAECFDAIALYGVATGHHIHYPLIGAGLANGDWAIISDIIESSFAKYPEVQHTLWIQDDAQTSTRTT